MAIVDLHLHTTASDGRLSPSQLVSLLGQKGIRVAAITDHDSTEGLREAYGALKGTTNLTIIPGIELSTHVPDSEVHILGYFIKEHDKELQTTLGRFRDDRVERARGIVEKLSGIGVMIEWETVMKFAGDGSVGRPHIALAMVEGGYVANTKAAFDRYLSHDGLVYVEREKFSPSDAISLIQNAGGVAVLAHPSWVEGLQDLLPGMKEAGLAGMEVYYGGYSQELVKYLAGIADTFGLIPCGGSDYHAMGGAGEALPGDIGPSENAVKQLQERASHTKALG